MKLHSTVSALGALGIMTILMAAASPALGFALRLEKDVPASSVTGKPAIRIQMYDSASAAGPVATQNLSPAKAWVSVYSNFVGQKLYRVKLDFTETAGLTRSMDLWWEFYISGNKVGAREPVPKTAWALFTVEAGTAGDADTVDGLHAADIVAGAVPDGLISTVKLADSAVTTAKVAAGAVGASEIAAGAVGTSEIADNAVTAAKVAAGAVGTSAVLDNSLTASDLAPDSVGASEIAAGAVGPSEIAADAVRELEIATGAVGPSEVADNSLTASDLAANSVNSSELADGSIDNAHLNTAINWLDHRKIDWDAGGGCTVEALSYCPSVNFMNGPACNDVSPGSYCVWDISTTCTGGWETNNCGTFSIALRLE